VTSKQRVNVAIGEGLYPVGELIFESDARRQGLKAVNRLFVQTYP
jgi:hypothetical protein